jgi:hypothetical protein
MIRAIRSYLPVVEFEPTAPASVALEQAARLLSGIVISPISTPTLRKAFHCPEEAA